MRQTIALTTTFKSVVSLGTRDHCLIEFVFWVFVGNFKRHSDIFVYKRAVVTDNWAAIAGCDPLPGVVEASLNTWILLDSPRSHQLSLHAARGMKQRGSLGGNLDDTGVNVTA